MPQPPNVSTVYHVLGRAQIIHGPEVTEMLAAGLSDDWEAAADRGHEQAIYAAAWQLHRARQHRAAGNAGLANMLDHLAEACLAGWDAEVQVRTTAIADYPPDTGEHAQRNAR